MKKTKTIDTPKHSPEVEEQRAQVASLREQLDALIAHHQRTIEARDAVDVAAKARALDAETFERLACALYLLDKLAASPAVDVIRTATLSELTSHARRVTARRTAPTEGT